MSLSTMPSTRTTLSLFGLLTVVWGTSFVAIKAGLDSFPPILFAALRHDLASLLLLGYVAASSRRWLPRTRADLELIAIGGTLMVGGHFALLFVGQQYVPSALGAILLSLTPMLTALFAVVALPAERMRIHGVAGIVLGFLGVLVVANPSPSSLGDQLVGVGLLLASAASFAIGSVWTERYTPALPLASIQAWMLLVGAGVLHAISAGLAGESLTAVEWTHSGLLALVYLGAFASAIGFLVYFQLMDAVGPSETSLVNYATPVVAAVAGWALLDEQITAFTVAGFGLILGGFLLVKADAIRSSVLHRGSTAVPAFYDDPREHVVVEGNAYVVDDGAEGGYPAD
ncbi:DMT family transporter [Natronoarchaeum rubrum]|uniref:DMT family transporter n=1 Tax=Natronoarchaeum rubrum TaxID=755311 RepID=UPI002111150F|nr:EamA family transporter [Natronoarchaeum rubrum]